MLVLLSHPPSIVLPTFTLPSQKIKTLGHPYTSSVSYRGWNFPPLSSSVHHQALLSSAIYILVLLSHPKSIVTLKTILCETLIIIPTYLIFVYASSVSCGATPAATNVCHVICLLAGLDLVFATLLRATILQA